jgi:OOP family OmpA-OmpF porin
MKNWKLLMWSVILAAISPGYALGAPAADDSGWYVGLGVGRSDARRTTSWGGQTDASLLANGITSSTVVSSHDTAWKLFAGYRFNENFAAEGGYTRIGRFAGTSVISAPAAATAPGTWDANALSAAIVGIAPIAKQFSAFGKLGLAYSRLSVSVAAPGAGGTTVLVNPNNARLQALVGAGLTYDVTKQFSVRTEWERFNNVGDGSTTGQTAIDVFSLSGQFRF